MTGSTGITPATFVGKPTVVKGSTRIHRYTFVHKGTVMKRKTIMKGSARLGGMVLFGGMRIPRCGCMNSSILKCGSRVKTKSVASGMGSSGGLIMMGTKSRGVRANVGGFNTVLKSRMRMKYKDILGPKAIIKGRDGVCPLSSMHKFIPTGDVCGGRNRIIAGRRE